MANATEFSLYEFIYPGPDCDVLCVLAISIALLIVGFGSIIFVALLIFICFSMPSKKAEKQMKAIREQMRNDWDEKKKAKGDAVKPVKTRTVKKEEHGSNGCDRSSTFQYVNFRDHRERVRFQEDRHSEDIEMQPLTSQDSEHFNPLVRPSTIIIAPPDIVIEHSASLEETTPVAEDVVDETAHDRFPTYDEVPGEDDDEVHLPVPLHAYDKIIAPNVDEPAPFHSSTLYDEVFETPRTSVASFVMMNRPLLTEDYYSDDEYLDARSRAESAMEDPRDERDEKDEDEKDSDRTMTLTSS